MGGSSSPLGHLIDHASDSFVTTCLGIPQIAVLMAGYSGRAMTLVIHGHLNFFLCQWVEHYTHELPTNVGVFGATEVQFIGMLMHVLNAIYPEIYNIGFDAHVPWWWCGETDCRLKIKDIIVFLFQLSMIGMSLRLLLTVKQRQGVNKMLAMKQILPLLLHCLLSFLWVLPTPAIKSKLVFFMALLPIDFAACKMMVSNLSDTEFRAYDPVLCWYIPLIIAVKLDLVHGCAQVLFGAYIAFCLFQTIRYIRRVIEEFSVHLNIHVFKFGNRVKMD